MALDSALGWSTAPRINEAPLFLCPGDMSRKPTLQHRFEYAAYRVAEGLLGALSWNTALRLGRGLGWMLHALDARHRRVVRENLRQANLGLSETRVRSVAETCFEHFGSMFAITPHLLRMKPEELKERVRFEGLGHWDAARAEGRGFIGLTGHYGNWEAMALALSASGRPLSVVGRELDNPLLEPRLKILRGRFGNRVVPKAGAARDTLKLLRKGECVGFLLDQDALTSGLFVKFMGRWASTFQMPALLALKYDLPVLPIFSHPEPDGTIFVRVEPALQLPRSENAERDLWMATQLMTWAIESQIHRDPRYWFWMHRRFKTRPGEGNPLPSPLPPQEWVDALPAPTHWA